MVKAMREFIEHEASGGIILMFAAAAALIMVNSGWGGFYTGLLGTPFTVTLDNPPMLALDKPVLLWINDGLMAIFFLLVGLEIKREVMEGQLSSRDQILLPAMAAVGGMAVPALVFLGITADSPDLQRGWAIPAATDIAFALGVLALLGSRVPPALKVFLLTLAILDDLGAIIIIALFYTANLSLTSLALAAAALAILAIMNGVGVKRIAPYIIVGIVLWVCVLKSGVHATLAGVALAFAIPMRDATGESPLKHLEHGLLPYVAFAIMPIFAFANAGVSLEGIGMETVLSPLPLGIALGLLIGKQVGVFGMVWIAVKTNLARLPEGTSFKQIYGVACLAGIGFTMSLFIGTLSFDDPARAAEVRIGVLSGSILSALIGYVVLRFATRAEPDTKAVPASA